MKNAETCHTQNVFSYRLIPSSWPYVLYRERFDRKGANRRFGFCPDFTGVEQCFRNIEDAMGHFILFPFRLTLTLARWLCIKGVTFSMIKALATWCPTLSIENCKIESLVIFEILWIHIYRCSETPPPYSIYPLFTCIREWLTRIL